jgi:hypothetical protein
LGPTLTVLGSGRNVPLAERACEGAATDAP